MGVREHSMPRKGIDDPLWHPALRVTAAAAWSLLAACANKNSGGGQGGAQFDAGAGDASFDMADAGGPDDAAPACDGGCVIAFASGSGWESYAGDLDGIDGGDLGPAKVVCLNANAPPNCPVDAGAVLESSAYDAWRQSLANAPGAYWIWRGDIDASAVSDSVIAVFQKDFVLGPNPSGTIYMTGDDFVEVRVNGVTVGSMGSVTTTSQSSAGQPLMQFDLTPQLHAGANTITVVGQNGGPAIGMCGSPCTYAQNPAGSVFGGTLRY
jgi:hypothetical protein